jgi:hypothetical protein
MKFIDDTIQTTGCEYIAIILFVSETDVFEDILNAGCEAWNSLMKEVVKSLSIGFLQIR